MSSSESSSDSESEEPKTIVQPVVTKNKDDSDSGSDSDSDSSSDEKPVVKAAPVKEESDSDSDSESSSEEKKTTPVKKVAVPAATEDSDSDSDSSEEEQKTKKVATPAQEDDSSDSDSDSEDEQEKKTAPVVAVKKEESDDSDSSSDEEEETKPTKQATENPPAEDEDSDSSSAEEEQPAKKKTVETEEVEEKETEEDLYKSTIQKDVKMTSLFNWNLTEIKAKGKKRKLENAKTPQVSKKLKAEVSKTEVSKKAESAPASSGDFTITKEFNEYDFKNAHLKDISKCVFVKGISTNCYEKDIYEFFTDIEKPLDVRHRYFEDRAGIAFVNFSSAAAASKAVIDKNNEYIKDRWVNTDWAEEKKKMSSNRGPKNIHMKDQTNRVWMGNLHREVTEDGIVELFKEIGELDDVFIIGRDETRPKIAYVSFKSNEEATKAVEALQGTSFLDNTLRLDWAEPRHDSGNGGGESRGRKRRSEALSEKEEGTLTVFVGRLSGQATEETLTEHFKDCGEISQIRWVEKDGEFKGVAFVEFADTSMTDEAVKLNGTSYAGREIRVDYAKNNKRRKEEW